MNVSNASMKRLIKALGEEAGSAIKEVRVQLEKRIAELEARIAELEEGRE